MICNITRYREIVEFPLSKIPFEISILSLSALSQNLFIKITIYENIYNILSY